MKGLVSWFASNHVAANLLMVVIIAAGLMSASSIKQEVFPEVEMDMITIQVAYPGAGPEEVEEGVVRKIEEAIDGLEGHFPVGGLRGKILCAEAQKDCGQKQQAFHEDSDTIGWDNQAGTEMKTSRSPPGRRTVKPRPSSWSWEEMRMCWYTYADAWKATCWKTWRRWPEWMSCILPRSCDPC